YSAYRRGPDVISPDVIDRILVGACAAVWLVFTGVSVAAAVALMDLGRGFHEMAGNPHTTWVLYAVIVVSALVIVGAIPVLLRARRMAEEKKKAIVIAATACTGREAQAALASCHQPCRTALLLVLSGLDAWPSRELLPTPNENLLLGLREAP
ncbi:DUF2561 family protein, partial [Klebsiella pneumoniae]|nr:DUF2561 family protein [Klebsiella pneumoniae]